MHVCVESTAPWFTILMILRPVPSTAKDAARRTLKSVHRRQNALAIKRQRGLEDRSAAGLEAQPTKATRAVYAILTSRTKASRNRNWSFPVLFGKFA